MKVDVISVVVAVFCLCVCIALASEARSLLSSDSPEVVVAKAP